MKSRIGRERAVEKKKEKRKLRDGPPCSQGHLWLRRARAVSRPLFAPDRSHRAGPRARSRKDASEKGRRKKEAAGPPAVQPTTATLGCGGRAACPGLFIAKFKTRWDKGHF